MEHFNRAQHWQNVYSVKQPDELSWFQADPTLSCAIIDGLPLRSSDRVIDVGGGASRLVDCLLDRGFENLSVLDIAPAALAESQRRLGAKAQQVTWIENDVTTLVPSQNYTLWHDRAVFHFFTDPDDRAAYRDVLMQALLPGGYLIIMGFALDGPERCSGLDVVRYDVESLHAELGSGMELLTTHHHTHKTPWDSDQSFLCAVFRRL